MRIYIYIYIYHCGDSLYKSHCEKMYLVLLQRELKNSDGETFSP